MSGRSGAELISGKLKSARQRLLRDSSPDSRLQVNVIFTTGDGTTAALDTAGRLAQGLDAQFWVYAPLLVPHRLSLDQPLVDPDHVRRQILGALSGFVAENDVHVEICLCRDPRECFEQVLAPGSLIFLGGRSSWRTTRERRLERVLRGLGHDVVFVTQSGGRDV